MGATILTFQSRQQAPSIIGRGQREEDGTSDIDGDIDIMDTPFGSDLITMIACVGKITTETVSKIAEKHNVPQYILYRYLRFSDYPTIA